jgi:aconitate hydratase
VIAESYERIHRSNLVGMGILPLQFRPPDTPASLHLTGEELFTIEGIADDLRPKKEVPVKAKNAAGQTTTFHATVRIDTPEEIEYYRHGGILPYVLRQLLAKSK